MYPQHISMKSIFDHNTSKELIQRLEFLTTNTQPVWGQMTVDQMLKHCQQPFLYLPRSQRKKSLKRRLIAWLYKPMMYNSKPFKKHLPVPKAYKVDQTDVFEMEQQRLMDLILAFSQKTSDFPEHPIFGVLTKKQWGIGMYKHLDHHLRQFGV